MCFALGGKHIASFYIDPYLRHSQKLSGTWMEAGRGQSDFNVHVAVSGHLSCVLFCYYNNYVVVSFLCCFLLILLYGL